MLALTQAVLRRWWLLVLLGALGALCAYTATTALPKRYQSTVSLQLNPAARSAFLAYSSADTSTSSPVTALAASYTEVLRSRSFGQLVIDRLNLPISPEGLARAIDAKLVPNTNILRVSVTWDQPEDAQHLAQRIAELFISENVQVQQSQAGTPQRADQLQVSALQMQTRLTTLQQQRDRLDEAVARGDLSRLSDLNDLDTRLTALETSYTNALVEINRARSSLDTATILDNATPGLAVGILPLPQALLLGTVIGLAVGAGAALLLERMIGVINAPEEVAAVSGNAPLAAVGRIGSGKKVAGPGVDARLVVVTAPRSASAEAFRTLRANMRLVALEQQLRTIVVTSAGASEGKTLISANLAAALGQDGQRVLLVDADLRRPTAHHAFGMSNTTGVVDALLHERERALRNGHAPDVTQEDPNLANLGVLATPIENLFLLPSGRIPPNPSELLGSETAARLLSRLNAAFDIVVIDTSPVGPVADALLLAARADGVLVVARARQTRQDGLRGALKALRAVGKPILGIVINDLRPGLLSRYSPYQYYYAGYYGKQYYDDKGNGRSTDNGHKPGLVAQERLVDR
jgi:non-specific protein-tyrosine kinase